MYPSFSFHNSPPYLFYLIAIRHDRASNSQNWMPSANKTNIWIVLYRTIICKYFLLSRIIFKKWIVYWKAKKLKAENGKNIWICGGANIVQQLINQNIIDNYYITVIPTLLGSGIRLFEHIEHEILLKLLHTQSYHGMSDLVYTRR